MNTAAGPTKTSSASSTPRYTDTLFWIFTRCPTWTPWSMYTPLAKVHPSPITAPVRMWQ